MIRQNTSSVANDWRHVVGTALSGTTGTTAVRLIYFLVKAVIDRTIMSCAGILTAFSRLSLHIYSCTTRSVSTNVNPLCFGATNVLFAEPLKKKKRIDPAIVRQREERRRKKLEKQIRRLEKNARQLKPIVEVEIPFKLIDEKEKRLRKLPPLSEEVQEERILLVKEWSRYKLRGRVADTQMLDSICFSQQRALDELRNESEELYQEAIQLDLALVPCTVRGPTFTPPFKDYDSPDGEYVDVTKKFDGEE